MSSFLPHPALCRTSASQRRGIVRGPFRKICGRLFQLQSRAGVGKAAGGCRSPGRWRVLAGALSVATFSLMFERFYWLLTPALSSFSEERETSSAPRVVRRHLIPRDAFCKVWMVIRPSITNCEGSFLFHRG